MSSGKPMFTGRTSWRDRIRRRDGHIAALEADLEAARAALKAKDVGLSRAISVLEDLVEDLDGAKAGGVFEELRGGMRTTADQALPLIRECHAAKPGALPDWFTGSESAAVKP